MKRFKYQLRKVLTIMGLGWAFHYAIYNDAWFGIYSYPFIH
jgi:hypothetical protein